jgi:pseudaminic acid biosynthesis-associated methylase
MEFLKCPLTPQEEFWAGEFGNEYTLRNQGESLIASNVHFFGRALRQASSISSCIEFGANIGLNLQALCRVYPGCELHAVEINRQAAAVLAKQFGSDRIHNLSLLEFESPQQWELVLVKGLLIHIAPVCLAEAYDKIFQASSRYILISEYYNPIPVSLPYRGFEQRLFKRDFAGELLDRFPQLKLIDYGFVYHRDPVAPQDDLTWFLFEK